MADDETRTKKRPAGGSEGAKRPTRKTESSDESRQTAAKRPSPKRPSPKRSSSAEQPSSSGSGSASDSTESQEDAQESPPSKSSAKSDRQATASSDSEGSGKSDGEESGKGDGGGSGRTMNTAKAAREAMNQLQALTYRDAEGIVGIEKNDDGGWTVTIEVVEGRRIPNTADVLAEYSVTVDNEGDLTAYSRLSRYVRGRTTRGE